MEVIIAFSIMATIFIVIGFSMRLSVRSVEKGEARIEFLERLRGAFKIINSQVESFVPLMYDDTTGKRLYAYEATENKFIFYSSISLWGRNKGIINVTYEVISDEYGASLKLIENNMFFEKTREVLLFEDYDKIEFEYYIRKAFDSEGQWVSEVDSPTSVVEIFRLNMTGGHLGEKSYTIPVITKTAKRPISKKITFKNDDRFEK